MSLRSLTVKVLSSFVWAYRYALRPWLPPLCRYTPTCSEYALQALQLHGPLRGSWMATARICRCHPFHVGGYDPVPLPAGTSTAHDVAVLEHAKHAAVDVEAVGPVNERELLAPHLGE
jgi:putative membrane protein insertion efficiency factor